VTGGSVIAEDQRQDQQEILEQRSAAVIAGIAAIDPDHVLHLADTIPAFDAEGQLVLATAEAVLWTGTATLAAQAAGGREQFTTLWKSPEKAAVTLTTQRLIYYLRDFTAGDMSWLIIGGGRRDQRRPHLAQHGLARTTPGRRRQGRSGTQTWRGTNARTTFAGPATVTATLIEPPKRAIRLHLIADNPVEDLAQRWVWAAATERLRRLASQLPDLPDTRDQRAPARRRRPAGR
jgi:hypothetical protein